MNKKLTILALLTAMLSCQKGSDIENNSDEQFAGISESVTNDVIIPTYKSLADNATQLCELLQAYKTEQSQTSMNEICNVFLKARADWELSEAFLEGPATDLGVDKHIDSWPLDETAFNSLMDSPGILEKLDDEDGDIYAGNNLGSALLGFHGIEYILFSEGEPVNYNLVTVDKAAYAAAVAGDLRNRTYQLYAAWAGKSTPSEWIEKLEDAELEYTVPGADISYAEMLQRAGQAGSILSSQTHAMQYLLDGCVQIADEVGTSKIGKPYSGEDVTYIESPYSWNSITDFYDNVTSISNVWGNKFPDGETYSLIYPEVTIPEDAFYVPLSEGGVSYSDIAVRLESTIGIYGTGLLDAIDDDDLLAQYKEEAAAGAKLNPAIYSDGAWTSMYSNAKQGDGTKHAKKFTYALSRGPVLDAAGANAIWNITNVTRADRRYHYLDLNGKLYATRASEDPLRSRQNSTNIFR